MLTLKPFQRLLLVPADPAVRQRSPQNRCWRSSVSDAHHSWQLFLQPAWQVTSVIQALFLFIFFKRGKKMYFHFETTRRCFGFETNIFARGFLLKTFMRLPDCGAHAERGRDSTCSELMQTISKLGNFECTWATSPHSQPLAQLINFFKYLFTCNQNVHFTFASLHKSLWSSSFVKACQHLKNPKSTDAVSPLLQSDYALILMNISWPSLESTQSVTYLFAPENTKTLASKERSKEMNNKYPRKTNCLF